MLDTSCAALLRLAQSVHAQGYKVALTGEGADEALAGYVWYKSQKIRDAVTHKIGHGPLRLLRGGSCAAFQESGPSCRPSAALAVCARPSKTSSS